MQWLRSQYIDYVRKHRNRLISSGDWKCNLLRLDALSLCLAAVSTFSVWYELQKTLCSPIDMKTISFFLILFLRNMKTSISELTRILKVINLINSFIKPQVHDSLQAIINDDGRVYKLQITNYKLLHAGSLCFVKLSMISCSRNILTFLITFNINMYHSI